MYTVPQILEIANNQLCLKNLNGSKISRSNLYRILSDPFYYGMFEYPKGSGNWYKGKHQPMITYEEFKTVQKIIHRNNIKPQKKMFLLSGLIRCGECGSTIVADEKIQLRCTICKYKFSVKNTDTCPSCGTSISNMKNPQIRRYIYYGCTKRKNPHCSQRYWITEKYLEEQIISLLKKIKIPEEFHRWAIKYLSSIHQDELEKHKQIIANIKKQYTECNKKLDMLIEMKLAGEISHEEFITKTTNFKPKNRI